VIAETKEDLIKRINEWKDNVENRGMRVNMNKTKVMQKAARWLCGVCGRGVGSNSVLGTCEASRFDSVSNRTSDSGFDS